MGRFDQAKLVLQARKVQKQLQKEILEIEGGDGAVVIEITGDQKVKKIYIDPDRVDLENIGELERWLEEAMRQALERSQKLAAEKMQPLLGGMNLPFG